MRLFRSLVLLAVPALLAAQTPADSAHVAKETAGLKTLKARVDSVNVALTQFCATKNVPGYLKVMCPVPQRALSQFPGLFAAESALVANVPIQPTPLPPNPTPVPVPVPTPTPTDSSTQPAAPALLTTTVASTPSNGRAIHVGMSDNLQTVLDSAQCGDKILLASGVSFHGNFTVSRACSSQWITVQTEGCVVPAEGVRVSPAAATCYAKLVATTSLAVLRVNPGAMRWRFTAIEVATDPALTVSNVLIELGDGAATTNAQLPRNVIVDRVYAHGTSTLDLHRCISLNADSLAVIDSYVADCHASGIDAQAAWGWNANGPFKIVNNYVEASSEVLGFGGVDPTIPNLVPSDIEIRHNQISRPMSWKGGPWLIKNLIEFKNARRAVIDANVMENSWPNGQLGWAFVLWSVNQQGTCNWCITSDVLVTNNLIRNVAAGFQLSEKYATPSVSMQRVAIRNNVLVGVDNSQVNGGGYGFLMQGLIPSLTIEHNTFFVPSTSSLQWTFSTPLPNLVVRNNLAGGGSYPIFASPTQAWSAFAGPGSQFAGNVVALADYFAQGYPSGNFYPATLDAVGLVGGGAAAYAITDPSNLALAASSPYKGKATDGTDPGANIAAILAAVAGVVQP